MSHEAPEEEAPKNPVALVVGIVALVAMGLALLAYVLTAKLDPRHELAAMARVYGEARDLAAQASVRHRVTSNRGTQERQFDVELRFVRPRTLLARWQGTGLDATYAVSDQGAFVVHHDVNQGHSEPAPQDALGWYAKAVELLDDPTELSWLLRGDDPATTATAVGLLRDEPSEGTESATVVQIVRRRGTQVTYWVDPNSHLLRRVRTLRRVGEGDRQGEEETMVLFRSMELSRGLRPETLAFRPGPEVKLIAVDPLRPRPRRPQPAPEASTAGLPGSRAPDIALPDLSGKTLRLSDFRGRPTLLVFWASWCAPCLEELPYMERLWEDHRSQIGVYAVSVDRDEKEAREFVEQNRYRLPVVWSHPEAPQMTQIAQSLNMTGIPASYVLDGKGVIVRSFEGGAEEQEVLGALRQAGASL